MSVREIDITKTDIESSILMIEDKGISLDYLVWFEVDKYFGTNTNESDKWINFYTYWFPDGRITAEYCIDSDDGAESFAWQLTKEEEEFFRQKMEECCKKETGMELIELWTKVNKED